MELTKLRREILYSKGFPLIFAAPKKKKSKKKAPECKNSTECNIGGKRYCIPDGRICGGKKRKAVDPAKVEALRKLGGKFEGYIGGKKNGIKYTVTPEMLEQAHKLGVSQGMLQSGVVPVKAQTPLRRIFNRMTIGDSVTKPKMERPEPKPRRKVETESNRLTADNIRQNEFTKPWIGAWKNADVPQDLLKVLSKLEPPQIERPKSREFSAYLSPKTGAMHIKDLPDERIVQSVYRHEFGHYIDMKMGGGSRAERLKTETDAIRNHPSGFIDASPSRKKELWNAAAQKAIDYLNSPKGQDDLKAYILDPQNTSMARVISQIRPESLDKVISQEVENLRTRGIDQLKDGKLPLFGSLRKPIDEIFVDKLGISIGLKKAQSPDFDLLDEFPVARENAYASASDSPRWVEKMQADAAELIKESKSKKLKPESILNEYQKLSKSDDFSTDPKAVQAAVNAADIAASKSPALKFFRDAVIDVVGEKAAPQIFMQFFRPDGTPASRAHLLDGMKILADSAKKLNISDDRFPRADIYHLMDAVGSTTLNKVGQGHDTKYYKKGGGLTKTGVGFQSMESFANLTSLHAKSEATRALADYFIPQQYAEYKAMIAEYGESL